MYGSKEEEAKLNIDFTNQEIVPIEIKGVEPFVKNFKAAQCTGEWKTLSKLLTEKDHLEQIHMQHCKLTAEDIQPITTMKSIIRLDFNNNSLKDEGLILIINHMPQLISLNLFQNELTNEGVRDIYKLRNLKKLDVFGNMNIRAEGARSISKAIQLEDLDIGNCRIGNEGLKYICRLVNLKVINLWNNKLDSASLQYLYRMTNLEELNFEFQNLPKETNMKLKQVFVKAKLPDFANDRER